MRSRLTPGGLAVTWSPTARVHNTFVSVFPHVLSFGDIIIGSNQPIAFDAERDPRAAAQIRPSAPTTAVPASTSWRCWRHISTAPDPRRIERRASTTDLNEDLFPRDEFNVPRTKVP